MSALVDRITEVLRAHDINKKPFWGSWDEWSALMAERIAAELQPDIDKVAAAMFKATHGCWRWSDISDDDRDLYRELARAAGDAWMEGELP